MQPAWIRIERGFCACGAGALVLLTSAPALSAPIETSYMFGVAPIAIALGALGFGVMASALVLRWRRDGLVDSKRTRRQLASLRAELDEAQAVLEGMPEITLLWQENRSIPHIYGPVSSVLTSAHNPDDLLRFENWLDHIDSETLSFHTIQLRTRGTSFEFDLTTLDQRTIQAAGRVIGGTAIVRLRPAIAPTHPKTVDAAKRSPIADTSNAQAIFALMDTPAWVRDENNALCFANSAYRRLTSANPRLSGATDLAELFAPDILSTHVQKLSAAGQTATIDAPLAEHQELDMVLLALEDGSAGYLRPGQQKATNGDAANETGLGQFGNVVDALHAPIALFDAQRLLVHANNAYREFWELEREWLVAGMREQTILDRLRTDGKLPAEVDYRAWRTEHLKSYHLKKPREALWYLPDGRALNVISVPAAGGGGVIYVFEDMTERLALESRYNALIHVQSETLNALSEGVAVFGTSGRLTLHNPKLSSLWKIPMNELEKRPHIDQIGQACATQMPEDGAHIWQDLKQSIVDLNPTRADKAGRINRADGRLIDYAAVRLPDGQTLITFVDVTESASYQEVLKERNDALITADRLKDTFVQNVSYELRSPLTNIIGFADLLASDTAGELNEKQKAYTDYIRTSSATLGVLIDNILDLATIDAGVAELKLEKLDIKKLVDQASAGLKATFSVKGSESPLNFVVEIAEDLPPFVADGTRIVQILYNLLSNAARFSDPGTEVCLTISARGGDRIVFIVDDEGAGIPDEIKSAVFQRFEGKSVSGRQRGPGLGLAIVRTFVNLHGGTISMEPRKPKGTRVIVNLPARAAEVVSAAE